MEFNWDIEKVYKNNVDNCINTVLLRCSLSNDESNVHKNISVDLAKKDDTNFIEYSLLNKEMVLGWCFDLIGQKKSSIENDVLDEINALQSIKQTSSEKPSWA